MAFLSYSRQRSINGQGWLLSAAVAAIMVALPLLSIFWLALFPADNIWPHLLSTVLPNYVITTLTLMLGVGVLAGSIGIVSAWLISTYHFPGRRVFEWALLLPMAVPAYVIAYVYTDLLEYSGPLQAWLRELFSWKTQRDYWFPPIRSLGGAIWMLGLVLYPYVYLLARASFLEQAATVKDAARTLGCTPLQAFLRVSLPMARPAIAVGLSLVMMETLNDFGTVDFFAVKTLTAGIYDTWLNMGNLGGAAQLAALMLIFVVVLIVMEKQGRSRQRQFQQGDRFKAIQLHRLRGFRAVLAWTACVLPVFAGFIVPLLDLTRYAWRHAEQSWSPDFLRLAWNSLALALAAAVFCTVLGLLLAYAKRLHRSRLLSSMTQAATLGYAMPSAVLAIGIIIPFAAFDNTLDGWLRSSLGISTGLLLSGTLFTLLFAYSVRFLAISAGSVESSLGKVTPSMDMACRSMGYNASQTLVKVHLPLIRGGLLTAVLVVFVDCMKELPTTLVLRPFNFDTLAIHVYQYASDERLPEASLAALLIVLVGIIPVILLSRTITATRRYRIQ
ncbi:ABC transporter permease [Pokkaliibacter plantistimulans]|nr:iron ABC transporter permease [Pokkaliibacter plantistimulans]